ncbi:T9SS type A sorting domain-containing protein, partial [candidate division KSB1 bacterium]|nr:T9SS type A sorting domain-containing protein [candidate division KSB1 bacterium]
MGILLNKTVPTIAYPKDVSQGVPFRITGNVTDTLSGDALSGLEVKMTAPDDAFVYTTMTDSLGQYTFDIVTSVEDTANNTRANIALAVDSIRPNGQGADFDVYTSTPAELRVDIYNILGQKVKTITQQASQNSTVRWDGRNEFGQKVASNIYIARISNGQTVVNSRITIIDG